MDGVDRIRRRLWVNWRWPACFPPVCRAAGVSEATAMSGGPADGRPMDRQVERISPWPAITYWVR